MDMRTYRAAGQPKIKAFQTNSTPAKEIQQTIFDEYRRIMENMHPCPVKKSQLANNYSDRKIEINLFYCEKSPFFGPPNPKNLLFLLWKISFFWPSKPLKPTLFSKISFYFLSVKVVWDPCTSTYSIPSGHQSGSSWI